MIVLSHHKDKSKSNDRGDTSMNLLGETIIALKNNGKTIEDVSWVGIKDKYFWWNEFERFADFDYNSSYGSPEINESLVIVGNDWWLERFEYDGLENWEFKTLPIRGKKIIPENDRFLKKHNICL